MKLSGSDLAIKFGMAFDTTWKCTDVAADGTATLDQTVDRIQVSMSSPLAGNLDFDTAKTDKAPGGPMGAMLGPMVDGMLGQTIKVKISPRGEVSDIELPEKLKAAFAKQQGSANRQMGMGNAFNEKGIKEIITKSVLPLPEKAGPDESWTQTFVNEIPFVGTETSEVTYSLAGSETADGKELVKIAGKTETLFEPAENPRAELEIVEQSSDATFLFDAQAGHLIKSEGTQKSIKEISGGQELTQDMTETVKMYLGKSPAPEKEAAKDAK